MFYFKADKNCLMALLRRTHPTAHHCDVWERFETCLDARSFTAAPLICIFGLVRLFLFNEGSGFYSDNPVDVGLSSTILVHRIGWALLIALSHKQPKLCRFYYYYEMLAMVLDSVLSLSNSTTLAAYNFTLLYIMLINVLVFLCILYPYVKKLQSNTRPCILSVSYVPISPRKRHLASCIPTGCCSRHRTHHGLICSSDRHKDRILVRLNDRRDGKSTQFA